MLPGAQYTLIGDNSPTSGATTTFGAGGTLSQQYTDLLIVAVEMWSSTVSGNPTLAMYVSNDTTATNYFNSWYRHLAATPGSGEANNASIARVSGQNITGPAYGKIWIPRYTQTSGSKKVARAEMVSDFRTSFAATGLYSDQVYSWSWNSNAAINEIDLTLSADAWAAPTRFLLYGISYERP